MATSIEPATKNPQQQYADFDEYVDFQLQKTRQNIKATDILTTLAGVVTLVLAYLLVFVVLDHWVIPGGFGYATRVLMLGSVVLLSSAWLVWRVVLPYFRVVTGLYAARAIEHSEPELKGNLLNLVDLRRADREAAPGIIRAIEKRAAVSLSRMDVDQAVDRRPLLRISYAMLAVVVLSCLYTVFSPKKIPPSIWRALFPTSNVAVATQTEILDIKPGDVELLARSQMEVVVDLRGQQPERVTLFYTTADQRYVEEPVELRQVEQDLKRYSGVVTGESGRGILQNLRYHVVAGDAKSRDFKVTVIQPPSATVDRVSYVFEPYMQFDPKTDPGGHIDAWEGAKVTIHATTNMPIKSAHVLFSDTEDTSVKAEEFDDVTIDQGGTRITAKWTAKFRSDGTYPRFYRIECRNEKGEVDPDPTLYNVTINPDKPPEVVLLDPTKDLTVPANAIVPLMIQARDPDFLLRQIRLRLEKDGERLIEAPLIFQGEAKSFSTTFEFHLQKLRLKKGDTIRFWIEAQDNKAPVFNSADTNPVLNIKIADPVSEEEVQQQLEADKKQQEQLLEAARDDRNEDGVGQTEQAGDADSGMGDKTGEPKTPDAGDSKPKASDQNADEPKTGEGQKSDGQNAKSEPGSGNQQGKGDQESLSKDGTDDDEVLRKLYEREQKRQQDEQSKNDPPEDSGDKPPEGNGTQPSKSSDNKSDQKSDAGKPDPNKTDPTGGDENGSKQPDAGGDSKKPAGDEPDSKQPKGDPKGGEPSDKKDGDGAKTAENKTDKDGSSSKSDDAKPDNKTGNTNNDPKSKPDSESGNNSKKNLTGPEKPSDDSKDATKKKATGDETGDGTPEKDPNADPTKAKNKIDRKPGTKPETKPADDSAKKDGSQQGAKKKDGGSSKDSKTAKQPDANKQSEKGQPNPDKKSTTPKSGDAKQKSTKEQGQPNQGNDPLKGKPKQQKSTRPQGGDGGTTKQSDQGNSGSKNTGAGDETDRPGKSKPNDQMKQNDKQKKDGANNQKGNDAKTKGGNKAGGKSSGKSKSKDGKSGQGSGSGSSGSQSGKDGKSASSTGGSGNKPADGAKQRGGGTERGDEQKGKSGEGDGGGSEAAAAEKANLEYSRKAANLVLQRLQKELERGEVDDDLLKELGWTPDDLRKFSDRLQRQLQKKNSEQTPESLARRRQFEEMLKGLDLKSTGSKRRSTVTKKQSIDGIGSRRLPVPAEYREAYEAYTKSLSKRSQREKKPVEKK